MFRKDYETAELAAELRSAIGVDPAILALQTGVGANCIKAYQRKLGLRKITGGSGKSFSPVSRRAPCRSSSSFPKARLSRSGAAARE